MDKKAQIAAAAVVGVAALGGFYWLGTRTAPAPTPVYPAATALPPIDQPMQSAPATAATPGAVVPAVASVTTVNPNVPRDTVSLLPAAQNSQTPNLTAQTPVVDKTTVVDGQPVAYVGPSGRPSLATPMQPMNDVETQTTTTTKEVTGPTSVTTSSHTVHSASTHKTVHYHKHQKAGNIHVARATKHTVMFAAKLPFRLRP